MLKVIEYIRDFFTFIITLIQSIGHLLASLVGVLGKAFGFMGDIISSLPAVIKVSVLALVAVAVLYKILGRENQS